MVDSQVEQLQKGAKLPNITSAGDRLLDVGTHRIDYSVSYNGISDTISRDVIIK